ncbi:glycosyltransferase family 4 protein [Paraglaciecola marina]|uniref:glycosyltransferase family 4 protein n=1 Tax=Paraglaciecola marina TaxID=2500157 RepID=UPI00106136DB|nr:glycosyltransferase family 4 protein [Paraglaciecola marina]
MQKKSKAIAIFSSSSPTKGKGISTYCRLVSEEFSRLGYNVYFFCPKCDEQTWFSENNITPVFFETDSNPKAATIQILRAIESIENLCGIINNDVIFIQSIASLLTVPLISVVHLDNFSIGKAALVNQEFTDHIVAISYDMYNALTKSRVPSSKCALVYNGVLPNLARSTTTFDKLRMMTGVEYSKRKGGFALLQLLRRLKQTTIDFSFAWFGNVPAKISKEFENDKRFDFVKHLPREEYLQRVKDANIYLFPSREEGCPMSLKEAMNDGLVPIAADGIGAMKNIICNGIDGYLLKTKNWDKEAFLLIGELNEQLSSLQSLSQLGKEKIINNFTVAHVVKNLESLICRPTVDRAEIKMDKLKIYDWHRLPPKFVRNGYRDYWRQFCYRFGILTISETISSKLLVNVEKPQ